MFYSKQCGLIEARDRSGLCYLWKLAFDLRFCDYPALQFQL